MNKIERILNILHYCMYILRNKFHLEFNKINPGYLLLKASFVKRKYQERGINPEDVRKSIDKTFDDKRFGYSVIVSGGALWSVLSICLFSFFSLFNAMIYKSYLPSFYYWIFMGISFLICYFSVFRHDKYLRYFKEYEKWNRRDRYRYCTITLLCLVLTVCLFFGSLLFAGYVSNPRSL